MQRAARRAGMGFEPQQHRPTSSGGQRDYRQPHIGTILAPRDVDGQQDVGEWCVRGWAGGGGKAAAPHAPQPPPTPASSMPPAKGPSPLPPPFPTGTCTPPPSARPPAHQPDVRCVHVCACLPEPNGPCARPSRARQGLLQGGRAHEAGPGNSDASTDPPTPQTPHAMQPSAPWPVHGLAHSRPRRHQQ